MFYLLPWFLQKYKDVEGMVRIEEVKGEELVKRFAEEMEEMLGRKMKSVKVIRAQAGFSQTSLETSRRLCRDQLILMYITLAVFLSEVGRSSWGRWSLPRLQWHSGGACQCVTVIPAKIYVDVLTLWQMINHPFVLVSCLVWLLQFFADQHGGCSWESSAAGRGISSGRKWTLQQSASQHTDEQHPSPHECVQPR